MNDPVAVIGAGIGGLTTALAMTRHGIDVHVCERAPELHEIGAGLGVWPAPQVVYERVGLGDEGAARGAAYCPDQPTQSRCRLSRL